MPPARAVVFIIREFYANAKVIGESGRSWVRGYDIHFKPEDINKFLGLLDYSLCDYRKSMCSAFSEVVVNRVIAQAGAMWFCNRGDSIHFREVIYKFVCGRLMPTQH